jgi:hypothetical protein
MARLFVSKDPLISKSLNSKKLVFESKIYNMQPQLSKAIYSPILFFLMITGKEQEIDEGKEGKP